MKLLHSALILACCTACTSTAFNEQAKTLAQQAVTVGDAVRTAAKTRDESRAERFYAKAADQAVVPQIAEACITDRSKPEVLQTCKLMNGTMPFVPQALETDTRRLADAWNAYFGSLITVVDADYSKEFGESVNMLISNGLAFGEAVGNATKQTVIQPNYKDVGTSVGGIVAALGSLYEVTRKTSVLKRTTAATHDMVEEAAPILSKAYLEGIRRSEQNAFSAMTKTRKELENAVRKGAVAKEIRKLQDKLRADHKMFIASAKARETGDPFATAMEAHAKLAAGEGAGFGEADIEFLRPIFEDLTKQVQAFIEATN